MKNFVDFLNDPKNSSWKNVLNNNDGLTIYTMICDGNNISNMIFLAGKNIPPLSAIVDQIEALQYTNINLSKPFHRQGIGCMVRTVMEEFGFETIGNTSQTKIIPKEFRHKLFSTAAIYRLKTNIIPTHQIKYSID